MIKRVIFGILFLGTAFPFLVRGEENKEGLLDILAFFSSQGKMQQDSLFYQQGLFNIYRQGEVFYWEIPDSLLGRDMLMVTTLLQGSARENRSVDQRYGYSGDALGPRMIRFTQENGKINIIDPFFNYPVKDSLNEIVKLAGLRGDGTVLHTLEIKARNVSSVLVEVTSLLNRGNLFSLSSLGLFLGVGGAEEDKSYVKEVKAFRNTIVVRSVRSYEDEKQFSTIWEIGVSLCLLPKEPMRIRTRDARVGFFTNTLTDWESDRLETTSMRVIKRWRLEPRPEDVERYQRGELVIPQKPIVFYIDRQTPVFLQPYIMAAVNHWQKAFEKAGFKNAIEGRMAPADGEESEFAVDNATFAFISYKASPIMNAYGPAFCDPRSGEIISSHVAIYSSVLNLVQKWYYSQCRLTDVRAGLESLPDSLLGQIVHFVISHEIGHTLGLSHNLIGSNAYSVKELRDTAFVARYGYGASIMDYMRFNYVAQPEDKMKPEYLIPQIGKYDEFAIEWGYRCFPGMSETEENSFLKDWVSRKQQDRVLRFRDSDGTDPRLQEEDLSDDLMQANRFGMENLHRMMALPEITGSHISIGVIWVDRYRAMVKQYQDFINQAMMFIGGRLIDIPSLPGFGKSDKAVSCLQQQEALAFLNTYLFTPPEWLFDKMITEKWRIDACELMEKMYENTFVGLVNKLILLATSDGAECYSARAYINDLHNYIFSKQKKGENLSEAYFLMQRSYVCQLRAMMEQEMPQFVKAIVTSEMKRIYEESRDYAESVSDKGSQKFALHLALLTEQQNFKM